MQARAVVKGKRGWRLFPLTHQQFVEERKSP
jgi:hypothetical protein